MLDLGIELAYEHVFGVRPRVLGYAEREAYAAALLLARMEEQSLEPAPVFCGDFRELDARPLRGRVGIFAAGLPCQPYSSAGKQRGLADERSYGKDGDGPLPHALRIIAESEPALVCLENVPQWVTKGAFRRFGESLCALGYEIEEPLFARASDVGASHRRERVFILAYLPSRVSYRGGPDATGRGTDFAVLSRAMGDAEGERRGARGAESMFFSGRDAAAESSGAMADAERGGQPGRGERGGESCDAAPDREAMADASGAGWTEPKQRGERGETGAAYRGESTAEFCGPFFAPGPEDAENWARTLRNDAHLAPAVESGFRVLADGVALLLDASHPDQLRSAGNGVVALQAAAAFVHLFRRLKTEN